MTERDIFIAALQKESSAEREAYLAEACAHQPALRAQVEALLRLYEGAGSFLQNPAVAPNATRADEASAGVDREAAGSVIGHYKLIEQIGEGGMGTVFMAQQTEPVKRLVALKIIKPGMDSKQIIARFEAERQALALMDHPNIAKVLDGGTTPTGRPYFVMELVKGTPLTKYCDEHRLTPRDRLALLVDVCQAVQHAHQKGIIHRDLKPSNVLVTLYDGKPVSKVIDFGVAKAAGPQLTERTLVTGFGAIVGTLEYMSPEQAELTSQDIDTRSDIYSLGVLLYELLTGTTPLTSARIKQAAFTEMLRVIREEEPPRPSTRLSESKDSLPAISAQRQMEPAMLTKLVRGELDWIVMKALEKDRTRRYETATAFAGDIEHYLRDEPVQACPPSAAYRVRKFLRRNRFVVITVVVVLMALFVGSGVSIWQALVAIEASDFADKGWKAEKKERERAVTAEGLAEKRLAAETIQRERADKATREAQLSLIAAKLAHVETALFGGRPGQRFTSLHTLADTTRLVEKLELGPEKLVQLRNLAIAALTRVDLRPHPTKKPHVAHEFHFDPDAELYLAPTKHESGRSDWPGIRVLSMVDHSEKFLIKIKTLNRRLSPNGRYLAARLPVTRLHSELMVWELGQSDPVLKTPKEMAIHDFEFSPDSTRLAYYTGDGAKQVIAVYDLQHRKELGRFPRSNGFSFDPRSRYLVGLSKGVVTVTDSESGKEIDRLTESGGQRFSRPVWHPHGEMLAIPSDTRILMWRPRSGKEPAIIETHKRVGIIHFSRDGTVMVSSADAYIRLWDPWTGRPLLQYPALARPSFGAADRILALCLNAPGGIIDVSYLDAATGRECRTLHSYSFLGPNEISHLDFSPDNRRLATVARFDGLRIWDLEQGIQMTEDRPRRVVSHAAFDGDGSLLATPFVQKESTRRYILPKEHAKDEIKVVELDARLSLKELRPFEQFPDFDAQHKRDCQSVHSRDGRWLASYYPPAPPLQKRPDLPPVLIDRKSGARKELPLDPGSKPVQIAFSPDSRQLVIVTDKEYCIWQVDPLVRSNTLRYEDRQMAVASIAYYPTGRMIAVNLSEWELKLIDPDTLKELATLRAPDPDRLRRLAFSSDGRWLVAATASHNLHVWDLREIRRQLAEIDLDWKLEPWAGTK